MTKSIRNWEFFIRPKSSNFLSCFFLSHHPFTHCFSPFSLHNLIIHCNVVVYWSISAFFASTTSTLFVFLALKKLKTRKPLYEQFLYEYWLNLLNTKYYIFDKNDSLLVCNYYDKYIQIFISNLYHKLAISLLFPLWHKKARNREVTFS